MGEPHPSTKDALPVLSFESREAWAYWLAGHHATAQGLWLKIAKKESGIESVSYTEALDVALCYGWIDGQKDRFDADFWLQRFTPRKPSSKWSKANCDRVARLIDCGEMKPAGLQEVEAARADGRWDAAYDGQRTAAIPEDLALELEKNPRARDFFATLDRANRYAILYRLQDAKKPETRSRRLAQFVAMLNEGKKIHP